MSNSFTLGGMTLAAVAFALASLFPFASAAEAQVCVQDDRTGSAVVFDAGGNFSACCRPQGGTISGTGTTDIDGCFGRLLFTDGPTTVTAEINLCTSKGIASVKSNNQLIKCSAIDKNTSNNLCNCGQQTME